MTGRELAPFETGEICVIGPAVFAGYYDNPEANAKAFRDGWFRTGDLGHMDARGLPLHHRPRLGHVHLRRLQRLSARDRGEDPDPSRHRRGRGGRRARPALGRGRRRRLRGARGRAAVSEEELADLPGRQGAALQAAEARSSSGTRCRNPATARSPSGWCGTSSRRAACSAPTRQAGQLSDAKRSQQPGPPAPERIQWVEARGRAFSFTLEAGLPLLEAVRRGFAAQGFAGGVAEHAERGARPVRLCDAGAVEDRRTTPRSTATPSGPPASRGCRRAR